MTLNINPTATYYFIRGFPFHFYIQPKRESQLQALPSASLVTIMSILIHRAKLSQALAFLVFLSSSTQIPK
jgi:uncharacterized membrane protein